MKKAFAVCFAGAMSVFHAGLSWPRTWPLYTPVARIDEASLRNVTHGATVESFDLRPDGTSVAALVATSFGPHAPLLLVTEDIATKRMFTSGPIGDLTISNSNFSPQVRYTFDGKYLVVQDQRTIRVFDSASFELVHAISSPSRHESVIPLFVTGASKKTIFACAFGSEQTPNPRFHTTSVEVELVDLSSGAVLSEWTSPDVPQAMSPDGAFVSASSLRAQHGVLPLSIVNLHGTRVSELTAGYSFRGNVSSEPIGRVIGVFVNPRELLLSPDENVDQTGHHSGETLELATFDGTVEQRFEPRRYGPTGELAVSADQKTALALSWYIPPRAMAREGRLPESVPEMLVLNQSQNLRLESSVPIQGSGLRGGWWLENRRPRIASDGSLIALAQANGITVFVRNSTHGH